MWLHESQYLHACKQVLHLIGQHGIIMTWHARTTYLLSIDVWDISVANHEGMCLRVNHCEMSGEDSVDVGVVSGAFVGY